MLDPTDEDVFEVWPENMPAFLVFLACRTQWRVGPMGGVLGFDYAGIEIVMLRKRVKDKDAMFEDLCVMERAALPVINEKSDV